MPGIEWRAVNAEEMVQEIEIMVRLQRENKYAFQVGLKDLDFDVDEEGIAARGFGLPFTSIDQAEQALHERLIRPKLFLEYDGTQHQVTAFNPLPVGYSGFMNCVTHSLALTDLGLFEVGRYPGVSFNGPGRCWQWFLHCRLANPEQVMEWQQREGITGEQLIDSIYRVIIGR